MMHSKRFIARASFLLLVLTAGLVTESCGLKKRDIESGKSPASENQLPDGVYAGKSLQFLLRPTTDKLTAGEENTITYALLNAALEPAGGPNLSFEVTYGMPAMPAMSNLRAEVKIAGPGKLSATYDSISMSGLWRFRVRVFQNGALIDEIVFEKNVTSG